MLIERAVYRAAHVVYSSIYASLYEERGGIYGPGQDVCQAIEPCTDAELAPAVWRIIGQLEGHLKVKLEYLFSAAGIDTEEEQYDALSDWFLGIAGHGVSIEDDYGTRIEDALEKLGKPAADLTPIYDEWNDYLDLALDKLGPDDFFDAYVEAALDEFGGSYTVDDIEGLTLDKMRDDCRRFVADNPEVRSKLKKSGHDFWHVRNGHKHGFIGYLGCNMLIQKARKFGSFDLLADGEKVYAHGS
jgi:hypothetical protein